MRSITRKVTVMALSAATGLSVVGTPGVAAELCAPRSIAISDAETLEGGALIGGTLQFTVTTAGCTAGTVQYQTLPGASGLPAATADSDFVMRAGQLSWAAGDTTDRTISVSIIGDSIAEPAEGLTVELLSPAGLTVSDVIGIGTIIDNDFKIYIRLVAPSSRPFCLEICVTCWLRIESDSPVPTNVTVHFATRDGSATAGADFSPVKGTVTIPAGATRAELGISIIDDRVLERDEYFHVSIFEPSAGQIDNETAIVKLIDDDRYPAIR